MRANTIAILFKRCNTTPFIVTKEHIEAIRKIVPEADVFHCESQEEMMSRGLECDVILNSRFLPLSMEYYSRAKNLKWIQCLQAGVDGLLIPEMRGKILFTSTRGTLKYQVSEHTIALMFSIARGLHIARDNQRAKKWNKIETADELQGRTVGIVGFGEIGQEIARKCKALDMRVVVTKRTPLAGQNEYIDHFYPLEQIDALLRESDYVIMVTPYTPETHHMIGERELRLMKKSAVLLNTGRGKVVEGTALKRALKEKWIAGAALDCVYEEPLPPNDELWELDNVIITPHYAAVSPHFMDRAIEKFCENLKKFINNEELTGVVHYDKGGY